MEPLRTLRPDVPVKVIEGAGHLTCIVQPQFKKEIKAGTLKFTDVGDDKGFEIVTALGIDEVPVFIVELKHGHPSGIKYILDE